MKVTTGDTGGRGHLLPFKLIEACAGAGVPWGKGCRVFELRWSAAAGRVDRYEVWLHSRRLVSKGDPHNAKTNRWRDAVTRLVVLPASARAWTWATPEKDLVGSTLYIVHFEVKAVNTGGSASASSPQEPPGDGVE